MVIVRSVMARPRNCIAQRHELGVHVGSIPLFDGIVGGFFAFEKEGGCIGAVVVGICITAAAVLFDGVFFASG